MSENPKKGYSLSIGIESTEIPIKGPIALKQTKVEREKYTLETSDKKSDNSSKHVKETSYMEIGIDSTRIPIESSVNLKQVNVEREKH